MSRLNRYRPWWQHLPIWLKLATILGAYPAWFFIIYCVLTGRSKSWEALLAFGVFALCAILHIIADPRNRQRGKKSDKGFDFLIGGD